MNITYIIGNGFDVNIGLKTKYEQFIAWYLEYDNPNKIKDNDIIFEFKKIIEKNKKNWSDVELALGQCTNSFSHFDKPGDRFDICYNDILACLSRYLKLEENRVKGAFFDKNATGLFFNGFQSYLDGIKESDKRVIKRIIDKTEGGFVYSFIDFNYTGIIDRIITSGTDIDLGNRFYNNAYRRNKIAGIYHVHGKLGGKMIFGVEGEDQIADASIFDDCHHSFKDQLIKSKSDAMIGEYYEHNAFNALSFSDIVYLYGVSIGETDRRWWEKIIEHMNSNKQLLVIIYSFDLRIADTTTNLSLEQSMIDGVKDKIMSFYNNNNKDEYDSVRNRIYVHGYDIFSEFANDINNKLQKKENQSPIALN